MRVTCKLIILTLMSISLISMLGLKQVVQEKTDEKDRKAAMTAFNGKYDNKWSIRWNEMTATPYSFIKHRITKYRGTPEQIAKAFFNEEKVMFGINNVETDLELTKTYYSERGGTRLTYTQKYKDIPVLYSGYLVAVLNDGSIYYVSGDYFPDVRVDEKPAVSSPQVIGIIENDLAGKGMKIIEEPVLYVNVVDRDTENMSYRLVYKASAGTEGYREAWEYIIDAQSSNIISKESLIVDVTGSGTVYYTSPEYGDTVRVPLPRLRDFSPRKLYGENAIVYNDETSEATSENGVFKYDPDSTHFDEVIAYYQCDAFEIWLCNQAGMELSRVDTVTVHTHYQYAYAQSVPSQRIVRLSDGEGYSGYDNPAKDSDVITHEYMHVVSETYHSLTQGLQAQSMDEAYSDYFSVCYKNARGVTSNRTGEFVHPPYVRNLDNNHTMENYYNKNLGSHHNSTIYSGALWDLRRDNDIADSSHIDIITIETIGNLDNYPTFTDGREAIIAYANVHYSNYVDDIEDAFDDHCIKALPTVTISGPDSVYTDESEEWNANASGGYTPYEYQWYRKNSGTSSWEEVGTSSSYTSDSHDTNFDLKVAVTEKYENTAVDTHTVTVIPPLSVEIDGYHLPYAYYDWENTWWAVVSGGGTPYTYAWSMRVDYEEWSDWESVGSDSIYNIEMHDWEYLCEELFAGYNLDVGSNIQLKVVVTDNAPESEEDIIDLEVTEAQKKIAAEQLPKNFKLEQNYPNPFNPVTTIKFQLPKASNVTLVIYNIQGQEVARLVDDYVGAGYHSVNWDASNAASGIYIYRLQSRLSGFSDTKRMLYIK